MEKASAERLAVLGDVKYRSIFLRTALCLFAMIIVILGIFYSLLLSGVTRQYREEFLASERLMLTKVSMTLESALADLQSDLETVSTDSDVTGLMIASGREDYDRLVQIMGLMSGLAAGNPLAVRADLYIQGNDTFYGSDGRMAERSELGDDTLLAACFGELETAYAFLSGESIYTIAVSEGRIFLIQAFPGYQVMARLVLELDPQGLLETAQGPLLTDKPLYIYLDDGTPLFAALIDYPESLEIEQGDLFVLEGEETTLVGFRSENEGLLYLSETESGDIVPPLRVILASLWPFFLVLPAAVFLLAALIVRSIYRPIQSVLYAMVAGKPKQLRTDGRANELDLIHKMYADSASENERLTQMLAEVAPAVTEQLFTGLISGTDYSEGDIASALASIGSPIAADSRCTVVILALTGQEQAIADVDGELNMVWAMHVGESYWAERAEACFLRNGARQCVGVICFAPEDSVARIKFAVETFVQYVEKQNETRQCIQAIGVGRAHSGISQVRAAYQEAGEELGRRLYYMRDADKRGGARAESGPTETDFFTGRVKQLLNLALEGRGDEARAGLCALTEGQDLTDSLQGIYQTVVEEQLRHNLELDELSLEEMCGDAGEGQSAGANDAVSRLLHRTIEQFEAAGIKSRNRHIDNARKYIADNYANSLLSLADVSSYVGISKYYLSRLFSDHLQQGFSEYLNQVRIEKAKQLLTKTDLSVAEVGFRVGFNSSQNFGRVFKKYVGSTPRQFSNTMREGGGGA